MIRLIHLADLHLGWQPRFLAERSAAQKYAEERFGVFSAAMDFGLDPANRVSAVVVAGDLFDDHRPAPGLVERVIAGLRSLAARGIATVVVPGNHDELTYPDSVFRQYAERWPGILATSPHMAHLGTAGHGDQAIHFYGMAYTGGITDVARPVASFPRLDSPGVHVAVIHGTVVGSAEGYGGGPGRLAGAGAPQWALAERSLPLDARALAAAGYDYVALGHIHRHGPAGGAGARACYAGLAASRGFDDPGCGFFVVSELEPGSNAPVIHRVPLELRRVVEAKADVTGLASVEQLATACANATADVPAGSLVRLELSGQTDAPVDLESLAAAVSARGGFLHVEISDLTSILGPEQIRRWSAEPTVRGFFVRRLLAGGKPCGTTESPDGATEDEGRNPELVERALRYGLAALGGRGR